MRFDLRQKSVFIFFCRSVDKTALAVVKYSYLQVIYFAMGSSRPQGN